MNEGKRLSEGFLLVECLGRGIDPCVPFVLSGNYLTTDQVLAVGGIQFQSEPLRKRNHLVELRMLHHATVTMSR